MKYYLLSVLMLVEIQEILIISTPRDINFFKELLEDNIFFGQGFSPIVKKNSYIINGINRNFFYQHHLLYNQLKRFWKLLLKYYPDLCEIKYYCHSFKYKLSSKDKVDYILDKIPELEINFNIYQDIIQAIKHNNFKRFEGIVEKYLGSKEKISEKMRVALKTLKKYMEYIKNMFETNITNGVIEGLNNKIKSIKRTAFVYSKFSNFKKRILIQEGIVSINA